MSTPTISASQVKELRDETGAGMMECKRALVESGGDFDEARLLLRERGMAAAGKRAGRETTEGKVLAKVDDRVGALVAVGCETEPVSGTGRFLGFARDVLDLVFEEGPEVVERLEEERVQLIGLIGENVLVVGAARMEAGEGEVLASYVHPPAEKIGVLVRARATPELARMVAMHIAAKEETRFLTREDVSEDAVAEERAIYEKLPDVISKPEDVRGKIVEGMLSKKFFAESVLVDQPWIHEQNQSLPVSQALAEHGAEVLEFVRFSVSE